MVWLLGGGGWSLTLKQGIPEIERFVFFRLVLLQLYQNYSDKLLFVFRKCQRFVDRSLFGHLPGFGGLHPTFFDMAEVFVVFSVSNHLSLE